MFSSIVTSPVVSSLNQPWLQGRGRRHVLMPPSSPTPSFTPPPHVIMGKSPGKDDEIGSLAVRKKGKIKVVFQLHVCTLTQVFLSSSAQEDAFFEHFQRDFELERRRKNEDDNLFWKSFLLTPTACTPFNWKEHYCFLFSAVRWSKDWQHQSEDLPQLWSFFSFHVIIAARLSQRTPPPSISNVWILFTNFVVFWQHCV